MTCTLPAARNLGPYELKDWALLALALWGTFWPTYPFWNGRRVKLRVQMGTALTGDACLHSVSAINEGSRPVTVTYLTIEIPGNRTLAAAAPSGLPATRLYAKSGKTWRLPSAA